MVEQRKPRDNAGALWKNKRKRSENHPDFQGEALIGGREYWVSGWARESAQGNRYTSLAFKPKVPKPEYHPPGSHYPANRTAPSAPAAPQRPQQPQREPGEDDDKDMPW